MKQLTIFVDMDGTIERLLDAWLARLNRKYGRSVRPQDVTAWDMAEAYPGLSGEDIYGEIMDDSIWQEVEPMDGAAEVLEKWVNAGHKVYIVTDTPYQSVKSKMDNLLFRYFPFLTWKNVIITSNKQLLHGDVMIDDGVHNLLGGSYRKLLFDATYNRDVDDEKYGLVRVHSWQEIERIVADINKDIC